MSEVVRPRPTLRQLARFGVIGVVSAAAYLLLYLLLRTVVGAQVANVVALVVTQIANTATNRRFTFGLRGSRGALRHQAGGLAAFAFGLALSAGALWLLHHLDPA
ncbi:MAG TPA: GtrA family protein, partial [Friedmanniella sp.]